MKAFYLICVLLFSCIVQSQNDTPSSIIEERKLRYPIWLTHSSNTDIVGLSLGFFPTDQGNQKGLTRTYGARLEVFPLSFIYFMAPNTPISRSEEHYNSIMSVQPTQQIFGFNISTGTFESIDSYGITITGFMHYSRKNNGISIAGLTNSIERANGIIAAAGGNEVYQGNGIMLAGVWGNGSMRFNGVQISAENTIFERGRGLQIGLWNKANNFRGIQIGFWNKNDKRSFPIVNWQFKS